MRNIRSCLLMAVLVAGGCKKAETSAAKDFFQNSRRRDATAAERLRMLEFLNDAGTRVCTAFFAANAGRRNLVVTARHCAAFDIEKWCAGKGRVRKLDGRGEGTCKSVAVTDEQHDVVMLEVDFAAAPDEGEVLTLAAYMPAAGTRLQMLGFPVDPFAAGKATVTENCWMRAAPVADGSIGQGAGNLDKQGQHNCSTWGGNSGGPMVVEGTGEVVALPSHFNHDLTDKPPNESPSYADLMGDFVGRHEKELTALGVVLSRTQPGQGTSQGYLMTGRYASAEAGACDLYVKPLYYSDQNLRELMVESMPRAGESNAACSRAEERWPCKGSPVTCSSPAYKLVMLSIGTNQFSIYARVNDQEWRSTPYEVRK